MQQFNIGLVFDQKVTSQVIEYAEKLYQQVPSKIFLGRNSMPHLTVIQFTSEESEKDYIWSKCKKMSIDKPTIILSGLTILPSSNGGAWIETSILKSAELLKIHELIITCLPSNLTPDNDTGDKYRPHITVARVSKPIKTISVPIEYNLLRLNNVKCRLAIGIGTSFEPCLEII